MNEIIRKYYEIDGCVESMDLWLEQRDYYMNHASTLLGEEQLLLLIALNSTAVDIGRGYLALEYMDLFDQLEPFVDTLAVRLRVQMLKSATSFYYGAPEVKKLENNHYFEILQHFETSDPRRFTHYSNWVYERTVYYRDFGWALDEVHEALLAVLDIPFIESYLKQGFKSYRFLVTNFCRLFLDVGDRAQLAIWANIFRKHVHAYKEKSAVYNLAAIASYEALADEHFEEYKAFTRQRFDELKAEGMTDTLKMVYKEALSDAKRVALDDFTFEILLRQIKDIEEGIWQTSEEKYAAYLVQQEIENWQTMAYIDSLTGVYNRRYYEEANKTSIVACAILDIDRMKKMNDTYGHACGDAAIMLLAKSLQSSSTEGVTIVRYGGDEFMILLDNTITDIAAQMKKMYASIHQMFMSYDDHPITFTTSMGLAIRHDETFEQLFERADQALYVAKAQGRHQLYIAENKLTFG